MKQRVIAMVLSAAMMVSLFTGCGQSGSAASTATSTSTASVAGSTAAATVQSTSTDASDKSVTVGIDADPGSLAPYVVSSTGMHEVYPTLYEYLFTMNEQGGELQPNVGESYEQTDDNTYRIKIFDNVYDSAGNHITSADIKWGFDAYKATGNDANFENVDSVTVIDDYTTDWKFKNIELGSLATVMVDFPIVSQKAYEASADQMVEDPVTTGPYKVTQYVSGSSITMEKRDDYWQTDTTKIPQSSQANADNITFKLIADATQMANALKSGEIDMANSVSATNISDFVDDSNNAKDGYYVQPILSAATNILFFNCDSSSPVNNQDFRQAIAYAIDTQAIVDGVLGGKGIACSTVGGECFPDFVKAWEDEDYYKQDLDKAKQLLASSGYDTSRALTIICETDPNKTRACEIIQAYLSQIGLTVNIQSYETALFESTCEDASAWDMFMGYRGAGDYLASMWRWTFDARMRDGHTANFAVDDQLQSLLETCLDPDKHNDDSMTAFHEYLKEKCYAYGIWNAYSYALGDSKVTGIKFSDVPYIVPNACTFTWNS
ncbi:MAG: ABC transporter substrate-binding protein [Lachnospiraceae bacterium]|jgi:ABC-type transport system substrate-binding protein|nr:ABC transporter substrate-binding protein [Lachnospiraceae bacterium]